MATHDYVLANASGAAFRTDLNNALAAIVSNNSNSSEPATMYAYQWWADTSNAVMKIRNSANNAWIELFQLDGTLTLEDGSASTPALAFRDDLDTGIFSSAANTFNVAAGGVERMEIGSVTIFNEDGADVDFRIEGDTDANLFYVDAGNDRVGISTSTPQSILEVDSNDATFALKLTCNENVSGSYNGLSIAGADENSGSYPLVVVSNSTTHETGGHPVFCCNSRKVGIGTLSPNTNLHVYHASDNGLSLFESGDEYVHILFKDSTTTSEPYVGAQGDKFRIITNGSERLRIEDDNEGTGFGGATLVTFDNMKDHSGTGSEGARIKNDGGMVIGTSNNTPFFLNRRSTDGTLINFIQNGSSEGSIAVSGSSVSYNGGHLSRWSQLKGVSTTDKSARPTIYQGTVMSNLDDLCSWSHAEVLYDADVLYTLEDTLPEGKSVGDVKHAKGSVLRAAYTEENQQLNMTKVSDTEGDKDVAGVFWTWDDEDDEYVNDFFVAMTGDMVIRVAASTTVARGDLLISAGDGTAKPQADDIIRSSTIAKIISTNHTATYADGSKAYPCVLMAC